MVLYNSQIQITDLSRILKCWWMKNSPWRNNSLWRSTLLFFAGQDCFHHLNQSRTIRQHLSFITTAIPMNSCYDAPGLLQLNPCRPAEVPDTTASVHVNFSATISSLICQTSRMFWATSTNAEMAPVQGREQIHNLPHGKASIGGVAPAHNRGLCCCL